MAADEPEAADSLFADNAADDFFGSVLANPSDQSSLDPFTAPDDASTVTAIPVEDIFATNASHQEYSEVHTDPQSLQADSLEPVNTQPNDTLITANGYSEPSHSYAPITTDQVHQGATTSIFQPETHGSWYTPPPQNSYEPISMQQYDPASPGHSPVGAASSSHDPYRPVSTTETRNKPYVMPYGSTSSYPAYTPLPVPAAPTLNTEASSQNLDPYRPITKSAYDPPVFASKKQIKQAKSTVFDYPGVLSTPGIYGASPPPVETPARSQSVTMPPPPRAGSRASQTFPSAVAPQSLSSQQPYGRSTPPIPPHVGYTSTAYRKATPPILFGPSTSKTPPMRQYASPPPPGPARPPSTSSLQRGTFQSQNSQIASLPVKQNSDNVNFNSGFVNETPSHSVPYENNSSGNLNGGPSFSSSQYNYTIGSESNNSEVEGDGASRERQVGFETTTWNAEVVSSSLDSSQDLPPSNSDIQVASSMDLLAASEENNDIYDEEGQTVMLTDSLVVTPSTGSDQYTPRMRASTDSAKSLVQLPVEQGIQDAPIPMESYKPPNMVSDVVGSDPYLPNFNNMDLRDAYAPDSRRTSHRDPDLAVPNPSASFYSSPPPINKSLETSSPYNPYIPPTQSSADGLPPVDKPYDPYAPNTSGTGTVSRSTDSTGPYMPSYNANVPMPTFATSYSYDDDSINSLGDGSGHSYIQYAAVPNDHHGLQYAPSPSLLGSNDPLSRTSSRAPVFSFGFGGKVASCFHLSQVSSGGFDVAMSSQEAKNVRIQLLHEIVQSSMLDASSSTVTPFPGPLFADPGSVSTGIMSTGMAANVKLKKGLVLKYLEERASEAEQGVGHLVMGSVERLQAESKLTLIRLLRVLVEHDGTFHGSPAAESDVRQVLTPTASNPGIGVFPSQPFATQFNEQPHSVSTVKHSSLVKLQDFLLAGERQQAYHFALDEKLWAHALLIANGLDKDSWNEAVTEFLRSELGPPPSQRQLGGSVRPMETYEGLKVAYGLFAGFGAASIQPLLSVPSLPTLNGAPGLPQHTPISPNFILPAQPSAVSAETLAKWQSIAVVAFNSQSSGSSATLTSIGDHLAANGWTDAAHCCYLLSPHTSSLGAAGLPSSRAVLLGTNAPVSVPNFHKSVDPFILTEIAEFALSLAAPAKGQDMFTGLAHLQAYRLIRASQIADMGHTAVAIRYCEAIGTCLRLNTRGSQAFTQPLFEQLKELSDRLTGAPQQDKGKSWMIGKAKPSLDTLGGWIEGRIKNFIVGDSDGTPASEYPDTGNGETSAFTSAFSGYSTISSANSSKPPSPNPSIQGQSAPLHFTAYSTASESQEGRVPNYRSSSAMDHVRPDRRESPAARMPSASASAMTTTFQGHSPLYSSRSNETNNSSESSYDQTPPARSSSSWWNDSQEGSAGRTPTATTFFPVNSSTTEDFPSLDAPIIQSAPPANRYQRVEEEDEDDLGLGNSKSKVKQQNETGERPSAPPNPKAEKTSEKKEVKDKPELKPSSSWLGWMWKKSDAPTTGPIKAKLGEQSSFYYDKDLKRWVNKKAGAEATAANPSPPPPPSRQATAPPSAPSQLKAAEIKPVNTLGPPLRPASAADLGRDVSMVPPRRLNLVPNGISTPGSAPPSPPSRLTAGSAPPIRPKSSVAKRNVRSRYVDIFQAPPEGGGA